MFKVFYTIWKETEAEAQEVCTLYSVAVLDCITTPVGGMKVFTDQILFLNFLVPVTEVDKTFSIVI